MSKAVKILVVGDGAVGKTCLAKMFVDGVMPSDYNPTVFENHSVKLSFEEDVSLMHASLRTNGRSRAKGKRKQSFDIAFCLRLAHQCKAKCVLIHWPCILPQAKVNKIFCCLISEKAIF